MFKLSLNILKYILITKKMVTKICLKKCIMIFFEFFCLFKHVKQAAEIIIF